MTGSGGWPMTVFLAPDGRPSSVAPTSPRATATACPSFRRVLDAVDESWQHRRDEVERAGRRAGRRHRPPRPVLPADLDRPAPSDAPGSRARPRRSWPARSAELARRASTRPGAGSARPRSSPRPSWWSCACATTAYPGDDASLRHGHHHPGRHGGGRHLRPPGGRLRPLLHRRHVAVPHFEKMLYDQAALVRVYLHAWQVTGRARLLPGGGGDRRPTCSASWPRPEAGCASAEDADSEGEEGRFYVWTPDEVARGPGRRSRRSRRWPSPSDLVRGHRRPATSRGRTILRRPLGAPLARTRPTSRTARRLLFEARATRVRPGLDDKVLTEWNAMFVVGPGRGGRRHGTCGLGRARRSGWPSSSWPSCAGRTTDGGCARWQDGGGPGTWPTPPTTPGWWTPSPGWPSSPARPGGLDRAVRHRRRHARPLRTATGRWLFTTGHDAEPSSSGPWTSSTAPSPPPTPSPPCPWLRLGALTGEARFTDAAREVVGLVGDLLTRHPTALRPHPAGRRAPPPRPHRGGGGRGSPRPGRGGPTCLAARGGPGLGRADRSPLWEGRDGDRAYVCRAYSCRTPATDPATLAAQLEVGAP